MATEATMDFENDQRLRLLSDALRAGPGTPEWRTALEALAVASSPGPQSEQDEYQSLLRAREDLASGRAYQEVHAGPGFTRNVFEELDREATKRANPSRWLPSAGWFAALAAITIIVVVSIVLWKFILPASPTSAPAAPDLSQLYFTKTVESASFNDAIPDGWRAFGTLKLKADHGLRPTDNATDTFQGGGIVWQSMVRPDQTISLEASIAAPKPTANVIVQLFVTDDPTFDGASATSPHELAWLLKNNEMNVVLPGGRVESQLPRPKKLGADDTIDVQIALDRDDALISCEHQRLFAGKHNLNPARPRTVGIRFLARNNSADRDACSVQSVRIMEPPASASQEQR